MRSCFEAARHGDPVTGAHTSGSRDTERLRGVMPRLMDALSFFIDAPNFVRSCGEEGQGGVFLRNKNGVGFMTQTSVLGQPVRYVTQLSELLLPPPDVHTNQIHKSGLCGYTPQFTCCDDSQARVYAQLCATNHSSQRWGRAMIVGAS